MPNSLKDGREMKVSLTRGQIKSGRSSGVDVTVRSASLDWAQSFAPTWTMVGGHKSGDISDAKYTELYRRILAKAEAKGSFAAMYEHGRKNGGKLTLLCYCAGGKFCHTHLLIDYAIEKCGAFFEDARPKRQTRKGEGMKYLLAVDLETTGLKPRYHEITQVGAILLDSSLTELGVYESLVRIDHPERGLEGGFNVFEYTHIDPKELETAPKLKEVLRNLETFVRSKTGSMALGNVAIFGQNPKFDSSFLEAGYDSLGWKYPYDFHVIGLESVYAFHQFQKNGALPTGIRLKDICKKTGVKNEQAHDAVADIRATVEALRVLCGAPQE